MWNEEMLIEDAKKHAKIAVNKKSDTIEHQSEYCAELYTSINGFEGQEKEDLKNLYKSVFEESVINYSKLDPEILMENSIAQANDEETNNKSSNIQAEHKE
jgi:hypothetical protein